ncbi:MAG TPA: asparaginase [Lentzea sp.]
MTSVALVALGGTIDSLGQSRLDLAWYHEHGQRLRPGELVGALPELRDIAAVEEIGFRRLSSSALTTRDWLDLARTVRRVLAEYDGVVLTHGTNTLEETAYFLHLAVPSDKPVVLTGAIRPASAISPDGHLNLVRAVQVAAADSARGYGALVVMNDTVFSARDVTKTTPFRVDAFQAPGLGPLGHVDADGRLVLSHRPRGLGRPEFDVDGLDDLPRVDVVVSYVGADGALVDAAVAAGARGIVSAGTGGGRPTPGEEAALDRALAAGVVVCQGTRVGSGRVPRSASWCERGVVAAGSLQPWKARVLLSLALTYTSDPDVLQELFDTL